MKCRNILSMLGLILLLGALLLTAIACEDVFDLTVENKTNQTLTIYIREGRAGDVAPGGQIVIRGVLLQFGEYLTEARNALGETVCSKKFTWTELQKAKWRVTITNEGFSVEAPK